MKNSHRSNTRITALLIVTVLISSLLFGTVSAPAFADQADPFEYKLIENGKFVCSLAEYKELLDASERKYKTEVIPDDDSDGGEGSLLVMSSDSKAGILFFFSSDEKPVKDGYDQACIGKFYEADHDVLFDMYADLITILDPSIDKNSLESFLADMEKNASLTSRKQLGSLSFLITGGAEGISLIIIEPAGVEDSAVSPAPAADAGKNADSGTADKEGHYQALISAYRAEEYDKALEEYLNVIGYQYADRYFDLIQAKFCSHFDLTDDELKDLEKKLLSWIDFEDASKALVYDPAMANIYLKGFWKSTGSIVYTLEWENGWYSTLPVVPYSGNFAYIYGGTYWRYSGDDIENSVANFELIPVSETEMDVYCYQTKGTYRLNKVR